MQNQAKIHPGLIQIQAPRRIHIPIVKQSVTTGTATYVTTNHAPGHMSVKAALARILSMGAADALHLQTTTRLNRASR